MSISYRRIILVVNPFSFCLPGNVLIYPFLKGSFAQCRILGWQFYFCSNTLKNSHLTVFWPPWLPVGNLLLNCYEDLLHTSYFSPLAFKIFSLAFGGLIITCFSVRVSLNFFLLEVFWASWTYRFMPFIRSGIFMATNSSNILSASFSLFTFRQSHNMYSDWLDGVPQVS